MARKFRRLMALAALLSLVAVTGQGAEEPASKEPLETGGTPISGFTYQGQLKLNGIPLTGSCDIKFSLWDAASGGNQIGVTQTAAAVTVKGGLFVALVNAGGEFGANAFTGQARWLQFGVRNPAGSGAYTTLAPRQALTPAPLAFALPGLYTQQNASSPNLVGGYAGNTVLAGVVGATIGGGGYAGYTNQVLGDYSTIGGGNTNHADGVGDTIGGGAGNVTSQSLATVGGGFYNTAGSNYATVAGGNKNIAQNYYSAVGGGMENSAKGYAATIGGGTNNTTGDYGATIGGGDTNMASGNTSTIGGGTSNTAGAYATTVGGGDHNTANMTYATVVGGNYNTASGFGSFVGGGGNRGTGDPAGNTAGGDVSTVGGGLNNSIPVSGTYATIGGGVNNQASGAAATIPGGNANLASGTNSFAAGTFAYAKHTGAFVWGDSQYVAFPSTAANQFLIRASGGVGIGTNSPAAFLHVASNGGGGKPQARIEQTVATDYARLRFAVGSANYWDIAVGNSTSDGMNFYKKGTGDIMKLNSGGTALVMFDGASEVNGSWYDYSDRNAKENFKPLDGREVLARVAALPIQSWNYKRESPAVRHIGPVAQDFHAAFNVGRDDKHIGTVDEGGVALAAIQGLNQIVREKDTEIARLQAQNAKQQGELDEIKARLTTLEKLVQASGAQRQAKKPDGK